jgi:plastocyanin
MPVAMTMRKQGRPLCAMNTALLGVVLMAAGPARLDASGIEGLVAVKTARDNGNAAVYIDKIPGKTFAPPPAPVTLDQVNLTFVPHVVPVLVGTKVAFPNSDDIRHNVFSPTPSSRFNLGTYPKSVTKYYVFDKPGPVTLLCNVHAEMSAYVIVTETPYFAVSDKAGKFTLKDVPPGKYVLKVWHEKAKPTSMEIVLGDNQTVKVSFELKR